MAKVADIPVLSIEEIRSRTSRGISVACRVGISTNLKKAINIYLLLDAADGVAIVEHIEGCIDHLERRGLDLLLLVRDRKLPVYSKRIDSTIRSCLTTISDAFFLDQSVFGLTHAAMLGGRKIGAVSVPFSPCFSESQDVEQIAFSWIIPHAGPLELLVQTLCHVKHEVGAHDEVLVGFDEAVTQQHLRISESFPWVRFYGARPYGHGPYGIRHELVAKARWEHFLFQDSDDIPLDGRVSQTSKLLRDGSGIAGSQCVYMDEIQNEIFVVRFPIDVNLAMADNASHSILFPSAGVTAAHYRSSGGLSTHVRHSLDTQFIIRSVLETDVRNSKYFCYLKRVRFGALTTDPATALGTAARIELLSQWKKDFAKVQRRERHVSTTSLSARRDSAIELFAI